MTDNSAMTAELDALYWHGKRYYRAHEADRLIAALRRERDEADRRAPFQAEPIRERGRITGYRADMTQLGPVPASPSLEKTDVPPPDNAASIPSRADCDVGAGALAPASPSPDAPTADMIYEGAKIIREFKAIPESVARCVYVAMRRAASPSPGLRDAVIDNHTASSLCEDNIRLRSLVGWISGWVTKPAASYSMLALDGFFASARDKIADLAAKEVETANPVSGLRDAVIEECAKRAENTWDGDKRHPIGVHIASVLRALKSQAPT